MSVLSRLERGLRRWVEGSSGRLFGGRIHPAELVQGLCTEMRDSLHVGVDGGYVANCYRVTLPSRDFERLRGAVAQLQAQGADELRRLSRKSGWKTAGPITVEVIGSGRLGEGQYRMTARVQEGTPSARLRVLEGPAVGRVFDLTSEQETLGRDLSCTLKLDDPDVSRVHAALRAAGDSYLLLDRQSTNGTYVNNQPVTEHLLADGDLIELGRSLLRYENQ